MHSRNFISFLAVVTLCATAFWGCKTLSADSQWKRHPSVDEEFNSSKFVFVGKMVSATNVLESGDFIAGTFYTIRVEDVLNGSPPKIVEIYDENSSGRFPMEVGASYLVFAYEGVFEGIKGPRLAINNCGNSGILQEASKALVTARKLKKTKGQQGAASNSRHVGY